MICWISLPAYPFLLYTRPMSQLILVVDDEPKVARLTRDYLEKNGFRVTMAADGQSAVTIARREKPDLVILDLLLPQIDGREVCRILRRESDVPIIMLTALSEEIDQVTGLEIGADDYITKPFRPRELVARVRAVLRRVGDSQPAAKVLKAADIVLDRDGRTVKVAEQFVDLTPSEFDILTALIFARAVPATARAAL